MKKTGLILLLVAMVLAPVAAIQTEGVSDSKFALGLNLGSNAGLAIQYQINPSIDLIANVSYGLLNGYVGGDVAANFKVVDFGIKSNQGDLFLSVGGGAKIGVDVKNSTGVYIGAIVPVGLVYTLPQAPWTFYLRVAPGINLLQANAFKVGFTWDAYIGGMYCFN